MRIISSNRVHLEAALALGARENTWTPWRSRALAVLVAREPTHYKSEWNEIRGDYRGEAPALRPAGPHLPPLAPATR